MSGVGLDIDRCSGNSSASSFKIGALAIGALAALATKSNTPKRVLREKFLVPSGVRVRVRSCSTKISLVNSLVNSMINF